MVWNECEEYLIIDNFPWSLKYTHTLYKLYLANNNKTISKIIKYAKIYIFHAKCTYREFLKFEVLEQKPWTQTILSVMIRRFLFFNNTMPL